LTNGQGFVPPPSRPVMTPGPVFASVPVADDGSGKPQWAVIGWPGHTGQTSPAGVVADGEDETHLRRVWGRELVPGLGAPTQAAI